MAMVTRFSTYLDLLNVKDNHLDICNLLYPSHEFFLLFFCQKQLMACLSGGKLEQHDLNLSSVIVRYYVPNSRAVLFNLKLFPTFLDLQRLQ